jgi:PAS domain-containing protein
MSDWHFWPATVIHPDDRSAAAVHAAGLEAGQANEIEYRLVRADGQTIWVRDSSRVERQGIRSLFTALLVILVIENGPRQNGNVCTRPSGSSGYWPKP